MPCRGGDQRAYRPHDSQFQTAIRVKRIRYASDVVSSIVGGAARPVRGGGIGWNDRFRAENDAIFECGAEIGSPFEQNAVFDTQFTAGKLDSEEPNLVEVLEDLSRRVMRYAALFDLAVFAEQQGGGPIRRTRRSLRAEELRNDLDRLNKSTENKAEEIRKRVTRFVRGR